MEVGPRRVIPQIALYLLLDRVVLLFKEIELLGQKRFVLPAMVVSFIQGEYLLREHLLLLVFEELGTTIQAKLKMVPLLKSLGR